MPRIRYLKPEFFTDEDLAELKFQTRLAYAGLWCYSDKSGRLEYRPKYLKAMIFPYDNVDMEKEIEILSKPKRNGLPFIQIYSVEGNSYIVIVSWDEHQRPHHTEKESEIPPAPPLNTNLNIIGMENQINPSQELNNVQKTVKSTLLQEAFDLFYESYPRKKDQHKAKKSWMKLKPGPQLTDKIMAALERQKQSREWLKYNGDFIPYPATWLNRRRWEDAVEVDLTSTTGIHEKNTARLQAALKEREDHPELFSHPGDPTCQK